LLRSSLRWGLLVALAACALAPAAEAATVSLSGDKVTIQAGPGEANDIEVMT
jgi:uncharacterized protein YraI